MFNLWIIAIWNKHELYYTRARDLVLTLSTKWQSNSNKKICITCKRVIQNGKLPQFAVQKQIRHNIPLNTVETLLELEELLVSLRIYFAQIRQWGLNWFCTNTTVGL